MLCDIFPYCVKQYMEINKYFIINGMVKFDNISIKSVLFFYYHL